MYDLTGFQRDLMYIVAGLEEPSGLAIQEELETYYDKEVFTGRLYPNLDALVDRGLIEKGEYDRRANYYVLTEQGRQELEDRQEWQEKCLKSIRSE